MADGIKISQLNNVTDLKDSDYTVLVHDGITCRTSLSTLRDVLNTGSEIDYSTIKKLIEEASSLFGLIKKLSTEYDLLSDNYLSSSFSSDINILWEAMFGNDDDVAGVQTDIVSLSGIVQSLSNSVGVLTDENVIESIDHLLKVLADDSGEYSLSAMGDNIYKNAEDISDIKETLTPLAESVDKQEKQQETILDDSIDSFAFTRVDNVMDDDAINPIDLNSYNESYDFFYDKNRFANSTPPKTNFWLTGRYPLDPDDPSSEYETTSFVSNVWPADGDYKTEEGTPIENVSLISANGLSVDENKNIVSVLLEEGSTTWQICSDFTYPGDDTFHSYYGIPLRYGMLSVSLIDNFAYLDLKTNAIANIGLYLNKAPFVTKSNAYSVSEININGSPVVLKKSNESGPIDIDGEGDLVLCYSGTLQPGTPISFAIKSIGTLNGSTYERSEVSDLDPSEIASSDTLFGMIVPMTKASQVKKISLDSFYISEETNDNAETALRLYGNVYFGILNSTVSLSVFYTAEEISNPYDFDEVLDVSDGNHFEIQTTLSEIAVNSYESNDLAIDNGMRLYMFAKDPRTGEIVSANNNGEIVSDS